MNKISIDIKKEVYGKKTFTKVIDTEFSELVSLQNNTTELTIDEKIQEFFSLYEELFYNIPKTGINSHEYIINKSTEYVGASTEDATISALLEEINTLREQLAETEKNILKND